MKSWGGALSLYLQPKLVAVLLLGIVSGLPLALTFGTLSVWLVESGVTRTAIGFFAAVGTPYTLKFLWSPLMDALPVPVLSRMVGRRRSWMLVAQAALMLSLLGLGLSDPAQNAWWTALFAFLTAFWSATQDIVIDAYRVELLEKDEQAPGAAMVQIGYRLGMLISGAGALVLSGMVGWFLTYLLMAGLLLLGPAVIFWMGEPRAVGEVTERQEESWLSWLRRAVIAPFQDFMQRPGWVMILLFVLLYKFGDAFAGVMTNPFLLDIGFSKEQIAAIVKLGGLISTLAGTFLGGVVAAHMGLVPALLLGGILQTVSNLTFIAQALIGYSVPMLWVTISADNFCGGMASAIFVAFISALCNLRFTATQYALLSSLAVVGRTLLSTGAGYLSDQIAWEWFFFYAALAGVPGILLIWKVRRAV